MSADEQSKFWRTFFDDNEREYYRGGDKRALIWTIVTCSQFNVKLPAWARKAIVEAYLSPPKSWDDVFGRPLPKGKSKKAQQRRQRIAMHVIPRVKKLHAQGEPIDIALFDKVAGEFRASGGTVRNIYYDNVGTFDLLNDPDEFYKKADELIKAEKAKLDELLKAKKAKF
jgi:hypothetical protein